MVHEHGSDERRFAASWAQNVLYSMMFEMSARYSLYTAIEGSKTSSFCIPEAGRPSDLGLVGVSTIVKCKTHKVAADP